MKYPVDRHLFEELSRRDPETVILPPFCTYSEIDGCYTVTAWGGRYRIYPHRATIVPDTGIVRQHDFFLIFLVNYLLAAKREKPLGEWISEKDLIGGVTFFRGPHEIPTRNISEVFGNDLSLLTRRCEELGGYPLAMADLSYGFDIIASVHAALLYWQGDEDFPAEARILLDKSLCDSLPLDVVYALVCSMCFALGRSLRRCDG